MLYQNCRLCPRKCGVNRNRSVGFCQSTAKPRIARAALHYWEEPCISGRNGSGAVFFSGCTLKCCYCQNFKISQDNYGEEVSEQRLGEIFIELQNQGAHNINLVNPTHFVPSIIEALELVRNELSIPIIYNCGGYESVETIDMLKGYVDIYLPDFKYKSEELSLKYSKARDYFENARAAIKRMYDQVGMVRIDEQGIIQRGVIIRHLILPSNHKDSIEVMREVAEMLDVSKIKVSVMSQYTPNTQHCDFKELNRRIYTYEYRKVLECVNELKIVGYQQDRTASDQEYTPDFNLSGVER